MFAARFSTEMKLCFYLFISTLVLGGALLGYGYLTPVEVTINDDGRVCAVSSKASTVGELLAEQGIEVHFHDKIYPGPRAPLENGTEVIIERTVPVVVNQPTCSATYYTTALTVESLLRDLNVPAEGNFIVSPALEEPVVPGMEVTLVPCRTVTELQQETIPFITQKNEDPDLPRGKRLVVQDGKEGLLEREYRVVYAGGEEISRELVQERLIAEPVTAVVNIGTKEVEAKPVVVASRGDRAQDYSNEGLASWYGRDFHGRRTSSGEVFNQHDYTAARPYLPFGTVVRVTFLRTGKSVLVTVNDRGPLRGERIIDLSRAAAESIGLRPYGVGRVKIEVVQD